MVEFLLVEVDVWCCGEGCVVVEIGNKCVIEGE